MIINFAVFCVILIPILLFSLSVNGSARFTFTSAFADYTNLTPLQKIVTYPMIIIKNYLSNFTFYFLFDTGDGIGRHQIANFGPMFKWQMPFLIAGTYYLLKQKEKFVKIIILILIFFSVISSAVVVPSPHTLRNLMLTIPFSLLISFGFVQIAEIFKFKKYFLFVLVGIIAIFEFSLYLHYYYIHYPKINALDWGASYKQLVLQTEAKSKDYDYVVVDQNLGYMPIYYHFYLEKNSPLLVPVTWVKPKEWAGKKVLYVRPYYGPNYSDKIISNVYFDFAKDKIFAQFWSL